MPLSSLAGTTWHGRAELWLDPLGDTAEWSDCQLHVRADGVSYVWSRDQTSHRGDITVTSRGASFTDTFHQPAAMAFDAVAPSGALIDVQGSYTAGDGPPWGWRIVLAHRPAVFGLTEALVLQMINIAPWGEQVRAVRMTGVKA